MLTGALGTALGSVFISFFQAYEDRYFTKPCLPHTRFLTGTGVLLAVSSLLVCAAESKSVLIVVCLPADNRTSSKRNFHRPESNCGFPLNPACEVFIMLSSRLRLRIRLPTAMNRLMTQSKRKRSSLIPEQLSLSSRYFLKHWKIDILGYLKFVCQCLGRSTTTVKCDPSPFETAPLLQS